MKYHCNGIILSANSSDAGKITLRKAACGLFKSVIFPKIRLKKGVIT